MGYPNFDFIELRKEVDVLKERNTSLHAEIQNLELRTLLSMQARCKEINTANGWFDHDRTFGDDMALLHSEVSEAFEAFRQWKTEDVTERECKVFDHSHPKPEGHPHICKPEGVGSELADVLVRLLDTCERYGIDLEAEFERKIKYNATRGYHHGGKLL